MKVRVCSSKGVIFEGEVERVRAPGQLGAFEVLDRHAPLVAQLQAGTLCLQAANEQKEWAITGGFLWVSPENFVEVLLD
ncbi:MAG: hypothetical protein NZ958_06605 [Bacteroidia bacterium]|nr:hypothetical protein [Bacteroidia bacterium]MDW8089711.1 hypothetical protein [Bacteroidia bacterium]